MVDYLFYLLVELLLGIIPSLTQIDEVKGCCDRDLRAPSDNGLHRLYLVEHHVLLVNAFHQYIHCQRLQKDDQSYLLLETW